MIVYTEDDPFSAFGAVLSYSILDGIETESSNLNQ